MAQPADDPKDVLDFKFRAVRKIKLHNDNVSEPKNPTQKLAVANSLGRLFAGGLNCLHCLNVEDIEKSDDVGKEVRKTELETQGLVVKLPSDPTHLGLNADETILSVSLKLNGSPHFYLFDTRTFLQPGNDMKPFMEISALTPPGVEIREVAWNPVVPSMLAVVYSNGQLAMYLVKSDGSKYDTTTVPPGQISCISWSPKGKQLVAGKINGKLTQYKPDLTEAKTMEPPSQTLTVISVLWISTYQFLTCYKDTSQADARPGLYLVQGSKAGPTTYIHYDDICYSTGESREPFFNMMQVHEWHLILAASSNAMEVGVMGSSDEGQKWLQWLLPDSGRAELPLRPDSNERYPSGMALAFCSQRKLPIEENNFLPHSMPILFLLSDGLLCGFYAVNQLPQAKEVTKAPNPNMNNIIKGHINVKAKEPESQPPAFEKSFISSTPIKPLEKAVIKPIAPQPIQPLQPAVQPIKAKIEAPKEVPKPVAKPVVPLQKSESAEIAESFQKAIKEEILSFEQDLLAMKQRASKVKIDIGTTEEKTALKVDCHEMEKFCKDLVDITKSQNQEIHELQGKTLETFEWAEEAKSRDVRNKDPRYQRLLKARALDPLSQKRLSRVQSKHMYLEQQMDEVNNKLDLEWEQHLDRCKSGGRQRLKRLEKASKETVYRVLVNHTNIIESQKTVLQQLEQQIKDLKIRNVISGAEELISEEETMEKLSVSLLEKTKLKTKISSSPEAAEMKKVVEGFSPEKTTALRQYLERKGTTKLKPDPELSKTRGEHLKTPKSKDMIKSLVITEPKGQQNKVKQTLDFEAKEVAAPSKPFASSGTSSGFAPVSSSKSNASFSFTPVAAAPSPSSAPLTKPPPPFAAVASSAVSSSIGNAFGTSGFAPAKSAFGSIASSTSAMIKPIASVASTTSIAKPTASTKATTGSTSTLGSFSFGGEAKPSSASPFGAKPPTAPATTSSSLPFGIKALTVTSTESSGTMTKTSSATASFGFSATTSSSGIFGGGAAVTTSKAGSVFGATSTGSSVFGMTPSGTSTETASLMKSTVTTTKPSTTATNTVVTKPAAPVVSAAPTSSVFGSKTSTLAFGSTSTTTTTLASTPTTTSVSSGSVFGGASSSSASTIFGSIAKTSSAGSVFGGTAPASSTTSIFGGATTVTTTAAATTSTTASSTSVFGGKPVAASTTSTSSTTGSIFGSSGSSSGSIFGSKATPTASVFGTATTTSSVFGTTTTTAASITTTSATNTTTATSSAGSVFGSTPKTTSSSGSVFGGSSAAPTSSASIFGGGSASTTGSAFGGAPAFGSTPSSAASPFGTAPTTASGSIFGSSPATTASTGSVFGSAPAATSASTGSVFGSAPAATSASSGSIFGGAATSSAGSVFGSTPKTTSSSGSVFGGSSAAPTSSASIFGGGSTSTTGTAFGGAPAFGSSTTGSTSLFGGGGATSSTGGGGFLSGLGSSGSSSGAAPNKNVFGASSTAFGSAATSTASQSIFGSNPSTTSQSVFGQPAAAAPNPSTGFGSFSTDSSSVASRGFGFGTPTASPNAAAASARPTGGFGSPPAFGGSPSFGGAPAFGTTPAAQSPGFGASPAFGSSTFGGGSTFGSAGAAPASASPFGQASTNAPTFGSIAQNTGGSFGAVAQQGPAFGSGGSAFGGSSSSGGGAGGSAGSFSSWR